MFLREAGSTHTTVQNHMSGFFKMISAKLITLTTIPKKIPAIFFVLLFIYDIYGYTCKKPSVEKSLAYDSNRYYEDYEFSKHLACTCRLFLVKLQQ